MTHTGLHYQVGQYRFYNPFLACLHAAYHDPHQTVQFVAYDDVFKAQDWSREPEVDWQTLLTVRAHQLRNSYDRLILLFSGGTDSTTVYNTFLRNNIFIDEIITLYTPDQASYPAANCDWILKNHPDPKTKITAMNRIDSEVYHRWHTPEWILHDQGDLYHYSNWAPGPQSLQHCQDSHGGHNYAVIVGFEKPHLVWSQGHWWATHLDRVYHCVMGQDRVEMFFVSDALPELHIKQNWLLLKYLQSLKLDLYEGWNTCAELGKNSAQDYAAFARGCGRLDDITPGTSFLQKINSSGHLIKDVSAALNYDYHAMDLESVLHNSLLNGKKSALVFLEGWQALQTDQKLIDYMVRHRLLNDRKQSLMCRNGVWSDGYRLT